MKAYTSFTDKFGNQYGFTNYVDFATFWFNLSRKVSMAHFPDNFKALNKCATSSSEAKIKI